MERKRAFFDNEIVTQVVPGVDKIQGELDPHVYNAFCYLIDGRVLIDCGSTKGFSQLQWNLKKRYGYGVEGLTDILGTHCHYDHISGAGDIKKYNGDVIFSLHERGKEAVEGESFEHDLLTASYFPYGEHFPATRVDRVLKGGETLHINGDPLEVYHVPGHSPDGLAFLLRRRDNLHKGGKNLLFVGDTVPQNGLFTPKFNSCLEEWEESLRFLRSLDADLVLSGHDAPLTMTVFRQQEFKPTFEEDFSLHKVVPLLAAH